MVFSSYFCCPASSTPPGDVLSSSTTHRSTGGWHAGVLQLLCQGKKDTRVWLKQQHLWLWVENQLWKLKIKQKNSQSRTEREVPNSLFLVVGRGNKVQRTRENPALSLRFSLCSGCAKLFTRVFKRELGGISTLALQSLLSHLSGIQKLGVLFMKCGIYRQL